MRRDRQLTGNLCGSLYFPTTLQPERQSESATCQCGSRRRKRHDPTLEPRRCPGHRDCHYVRVRLREVEL